VTTWAMASGRYLRATDITSGAVLVAELQLGAALQPIMSFACGAYVIIFGTNDTGDHLHLWRFNPATLTVDLEVNFVAIAGAVALDAAPRPDGSGFILAWTVPSTRTDTIHLARFDTAMTLLFSTTVAPTGVCDCLAVGCSDTYVGLTFSDDVAGTKNLKFATLTMVLGGLAGPTTYTPWTLLYGLSVGVDAAGEFFALISIGSFTGANLTGAVRFTTAAVVDGSPRFLYNVNVCSRPTLIDGRMYAMVDKGLICIDGRTDGYPLELEGIIAPADSQGPAPVIQPRKFLQYNATTQEAVTVIRITVTASGMLSGIDRAVFNFDLTGAPKWLSAEAQGCLHASGSFLGSFDGIRSVEHGFVDAPRISLGSVTAGTGSIAGGTPAISYLYQACYEWMDEQGNVHRSEPSNSLVVAVDLASTNATVIIKVLTCDLTKRAMVGSRQVRIALFRSTGNSPEQLYRIDAFGTGIPSLINVGSVNYTDTKSDIQLLSSGNGLIYTDGGVLPAQACPGMTHVISHKNRLWGAVAEDGRLVWFTRQFSRFEAPAWHNALSFRVDDSPDEITALAPLDDKVIIFTRTRVYYVTGEGPNDTGTQGAFSDPILITSTAGCVDARSVISYDGGVFFSDPSGLMRLDRALNVAFAGAPMQGTIRQFSTIRGVTKDAIRNRLIWLVQCDGVPPAILVVYDWLHNAWSTWTLNISGYQANASQAIWNGKHVVVASLPVTRFCVEGGALDPLSTYPVGTIELPWVRLGAIGGYQRVRRVMVTGDRKSPHYLSAAISQDFATNTVQSVTWDNGNGYSPPQSPVIRRDLHVRQQKVSAIKITLTDAPHEDASSYGATGLSIVGVSLELGMLKGRAKIGQKALIA
jgi:hypothetical protein